jgi:hypothetical protein
MMLVHNGVKFILIHALRRTHALRHRSDKAFQMVTHLHAR